MPSKIPGFRPKNKQTRKDYLKQYDKQRREENESRKWYSLARWRDPVIGLRALILSRDPWCVRCDAEDIATPSTTANHIRPHKGDPELFWDEDNLEGVCAPHHSRDIQREEHAAGYHKRKRT